MRLRIFLSLVLALLIFGCRTRPEKPHVAAGTIEQLNGRVDIDSADLVGIDVLLDGGNTAFFIKDKAGAVCILKYAKSSSGHASFSFIYSNGAEVRASSSSLMRLMNSLSRAIPGNGSGRQARAELIRLLNNPLWIERSMPQWRSLWMAQ